jgi:hypothetical protein
MKKMKTLLVKDENHLATEEIQCPWVFDDGVQAYIKSDGSACMIKDGVLYKRYDAKRNKKTGEFKQPPEGSIPCCEPDEVTGHWPHWAVCTREDKWHMEAFNGSEPDGTYELIGPKVNGNHERVGKHELLSHKKGIQDLTSVKFDYAGIKSFIECLPHEGIVFHHPDGRMCKVRRKDFEFDWPIVK